MPEAASLYAVPGVLAAIPCFLREYFVKLAGTPKFLQQGFLQKLTSIPATEGGVDGTSEGAFGGEEITAKEKSPISR